MGVAGSTELVRRRAEADSRTGFSETLSSSAAREQGRCCAGWVSDDAESAVFAHCFGRHQDFSTELFTPFDTPFEVGDHDVDKPLRR